MKTAMDSSVSPLSLKPPEASYGLGVLIWDVLDEAWGL